MSKKGISILFAIVLLLTGIFAFSSVSFAATSGSCGTSATYKYDETTKTLTISGTGSTKTFGTTVLNRVPWYSYKAECTSIIVEEGITGLGTYTFYQMSAAKSLSLPSTLTSTSLSACQEMTSLESITFGHGLKSLAMNTFKDCSSLKSVTFSDSLTDIGLNAFSGTGLTSVTIPDSVTSLGNYAFSDCTSLTSVKYGTGLTSTGNNVFYNSAVKTVDFGEKITTIGTYCFFNTSFKIVDIPEQITAIGMRAFANCYYITDVFVYNSQCEYQGLGQYDGDVGQDPFNGSQQSLIMHGHSKSTTETYATAKGYTFYSVDPCTHDETYDEVIDATCTATGLITTICSNCGTIVSTKTVAALGHDFVTYETDDTTDLDGHVYEYQKCSRCEETNIKITHNAWVDGNYKVTTTATCTRSGIETKTCDICGKTERAVIVAKGHTVPEESYTDYVAPTCTTEGSAKGLCSVCGENVAVIIPALGHTYEETSSYDTEDGHTYKTSKCTVCGDEKTEVIHNEWIDGYYKTEIQSAPTCTSNGTTLYTCDVCGTTKTETAYMTGHSWDEGVVTTEPTCTVAGTKTYTCQNCGSTRTSSIASLGHDYSVDSIVSAPTCTTAGTGKLQCSRCTAANTYSIPALGHNIENAEDYHIVTEPTCTEVGVAEGTCANCNETAQVDIDALGHDYDEATYTITTEPTCTEAGEATEACKRCGETETLSVPALGHDYVFTSISQGNQMSSLNYSCTRCKASTSYYATAINTVFGQYVGKYKKDINNGYRIDVNCDGIINSRDFAIINGYKSN